jgi:hypothetical protein
VGLGRVMGWPLRRESGRWTDRTRTEKGGIYAAYLGSLVVSYVLRILDVVLLVIREMVVRWWCGSVWGVWCALLTLSSRFAHLSGYMEEG